MTYSVNMLTPAPHMTITCRSGNIYTSDSYGFVANVSGQDITDLAAADCISLGLLGHGVSLPWQAGGFYQGIDGVTPVAVLTVTGTLYAIPVFVPNSATLSTVNYSVTTGQTGGKVRGALYRDNGLGYPGAIVSGTDTGDLTATGTAVETATLSPTVALNPGWYWQATIATASSTMPSIIGATAGYGNTLPGLLGFDTAAHALATTSEDATGLALTGQTYPATNMTTSFPTFPTGATLTFAAATPIAAYGV